MKNFQVTYFNYDLLSRFNNKNDISLENQEMSVKDPDTHFILRR